MSDFDLRLGNSDAIARKLVGEAYSATGEINAPLKRLLLGRGEYQLDQLARAQLIRMEAFLLEAARDARAVLEAQMAPILEAAE